MAKNRIMQTKNDKVKREDSKRIKERRMIIMCHESVPTETINYVPYMETDFDSNFAIQMRVKAFMGKHYNVIRFSKRYPEIYKYLLVNTVAETKRKFATEFSLIMQGLL